MRRDTGNSTNAKAWEQIGDYTGSIVAAVLASFLFSLLMRSLGISGGFADSLEMAILFAVLIGDPIGALREGKTWRDVKAKIGSGAILGFAVATMMNLLFVDHSISELSSKMSVTSGGVVQDTSARGSLIWMFLLPALVLPIAMLAPVVERILAGTNAAGDELTVEDLKQSLVFPVSVSVFFILNFAVAGALWAVNAAIWAGLVFITLGVLLTVTDVWNSPREEIEQDLQENWAEHPDEEAPTWIGLDKLFRRSWPSALFNGGMMYTMIAAIMLLTVGSDGLGETIGGVLMNLGWFMVLATITLVSLVAYGFVLTVSVTYLLGRKNNLDPLTIAELAKVAMLRAFLGGVGHTRPA